MKCKNYKLFQLAPIDFCDLDLFRDAQRVTPRYGGRGGGSFNSREGAVSAIFIRSGRLIDSIRLVYRNGHSSRRYGGNGGRL